MLLYKILFWKKQSLPILSHIDDKSDDGKVDSTLKCTQLNVDDLASNVSKVEIKHEDKLSSESAERPLLVTIHATGVIENSPYSVFNNDEWGSILRFLASKEHLKKNIEDVKYTSLRTTESSKNLFVHVVELQILVKRHQLWESPRSYIWKHMGQDSWERNNGSSIKLFRIHQK